MLTDFRSATDIQTQCRLLKLGYASSYVTRRFDLLDDIQIFFASNVLHYSQVAEQIDWKQARIFCRHIAFVLRVCLSSSFFIALPFYWIKFVSITPGRRGKMTPKSI